MLSAPFLRGAIRQAPTRSARRLRRALLALIGMFALCLPAIAAYKLSPALFPAPDIVAAPEPGCDVALSACVANVPGGTVRLEFLTHPVPLVKPFRVALTTQGISPDRIEIDLAGMEMDMGPNRTAFRSTGTGSGSHGAETSLPACVAGAMKWRATIILYTGHQRTVIPYEFLAGTNR